MSKEQEMYQTEDTHVSVNVIFADETFWMTEKEMEKLFKVDISVISNHLSNIFDEEELDKGATVSKVEMVQTKGKH